MKKVKTRLTGGMQTILPALLWFAKTMKGGKSGPEKYYQIRSNEYLITCEK